MVKVKNLKGTSKERYSCDCCDSWIAHWKKHTARTPYCMACKKKSDLVGAHVKKVNTYDDAWYITPLCKACNNKADLEFDVIRDDLIEVTACNK